MLWPLFEVATLTFWFALAFLFLVAVYLDHTNAHGGEAFLVLATLGAVTLLTSFNPFTWTYHNPQTFLLWVIVYLVAGVVWSILKWVIFVLDAKSQFLRDESNYRKQYETAYKQAYPTFLDWVTSKTNNDYPPRATRHKGRIIAWMAYWPFSIVASLLGDFIYRIFETLYNLIAHSFQAISNSITASTLKDK